MGQFSSTITKERGKATMGATESTIETITRVDGNGRPYTLPLPRLQIVGTMNDVAKENLETQTGLQFTLNFTGLTAQPTHGWQIAALLMTCNFKTRFYNNGSTHNTLFLKHDHHVGYDVDSICAKCARENNIPVMCNVPEDEQTDDFRLAC